ncbi:YraN family protein [Arthrobacter castelli]|uniref:YraN family protein n=1 Tax=Arthrobacter castelli TaxID=271431 RepID=UPI0004010B95|nr:YraN family protein [Arthrobacter castelli]
MKAKDEVGQRGEATAARYLEESGLRVIDRNWRCSDGEIDIVALDGDVLVVVEVKTRSSLDYGHPFEAINEPKLQRLQRLSAAWRRFHHLRIRNHRIDAVAVIEAADASATVEYLKAVG